MDWAHTTQNWSYTLNFAFIPILDWKHFSDGADKIVQTKDDGSSLFVKGWKTKDSGDQHEDEADVALFLFC